MKYTEQKRFEFLFSIDHSMRLLLAVITLFFSSIYTYANTDGGIQLQGFIKNESGYVVDKIEIAIFKGGILICEGKSDRDGKYSVTLPEDGKYHIIVGNGNNNYYTINDTNIQILPLKVFRKDFTLYINKQELQHKTTRLLEAHDHLVKNPMNIYYKGIFFNRFPRNMDEMLLFFSPRIPYFNLKKESEKVITKYVDTKMVSDTSYFFRHCAIIMGYTEQVDIKCLKYYSARMNGMIFTNTKGFFDVLHTYNNNDMRFLLNLTVKGFTRIQLDESFEKLGAYIPRVYAIYKEVDKQLGIK